MFPKVKPPGATTRGGWGNAHIKARKAAAAKHRPSDPCARCGHPLGPMGSWLHYDHTDNRDGYLGFSHGSRRCPWCGKRCNIRAGAQKGARLSKARAMVTRLPESLRW